jgi:phosphatidylserine decarboxylase
MLIEHRVGHWLPRNQKVLESWLAKKIAQVEHPSRSVKKPHHVIQEFQKLIEDDPEIFMGFHQMFEQVPTKPPYNNDPTGKPQVPDSG